MVSTLTGVVGGLIGAAVAAAIHRAVDDEPSPSTVVWAKYLGDGVPDHYEVHGVVVHLGYGAVAGGAFVWFLGALGEASAALADTLVWAIVWAAVLAATAIGFWVGFVLGRRPDSSSLLSIAATHFGYGLALGVVVSLLGSL